MTLLKTPTAQLAINGGSQHPDKRKAGGHGPTLADEVEHLIPQMLPTPTSRDWKDHTIRREPHRPDDTDTLARALTDVPCALLPTPAVNDMGAAYTPETWDAWTDRMKAEHGNGNGNGHGKSLSIEAQRLLPTPTSADSKASGGSTPSDVTLTDAVVRTDMGTKANERLLPTPRVTTGGSIASQKRVREVLDGEVLETADCRLELTAEVLAHRGMEWGDYAPAIHRWEQILGRPAPAPTMTSAKGNPQLSPRFVEWMMGLPEGWVDDVPDLTRNEKLKALGNGVVSQQAVEAVLRLLALGEVAA